jgi:hypothetical protein
LPAPNRIRTISRISTTCQIPMLIRSSLIACRDRSSHDALPQLM